MHPNNGYFSVVPKNDSPEKKCITKIFFLFVEFFVQKVHTLFGGEHTIILRLYIQIVFPIRIISISHIFCFF